jgi:tetratricopeptide (TPR) repeat protein
MKPIPIVALLPLPPPRLRLLALIASIALATGAGFAADFDDMSFKQIVEAVKSEGEAVRLVEILAGNLRAKKNFDRARALLDEATAALQDQWLLATLAASKAEVFHAEGKHDEAIETLSAACAQMASELKTRESLDEAKQQQLSEWRRRLRNWRLARRGVDVAEAAFLYTLVGADKEEVAVIFHYGDIEWSDAPKVQEVSVIPPKPPGGESRLRQLIYFLTQEDAKIELETIWSADRERQIQKMGFSPPPKKRQFEDGKETQEAYIVVSKEGAALRFTFHWLGKEMISVNVEEVTPQWKIEQ